MKKQAVVLFSGGLDSILAARLMIELGIDVVCVHYHIDFAVCSGGETCASKAAKALGVTLKIFDVTAEYLEMFKSPRHGYGANINPCIDCKIFMLKKAKSYMEQIGASFLVTGEVLGERPMSQRKDALNTIEKKADVRGILLRPLSAKLLKPTIPETSGTIDREKLLDIRGRSRRPQLGLAAKYHIKEFPNPAGGCLLTDPGFTRRVKDLIAHEGLTVDALKLLKVGRHFRLSDRVKLVIGRDKKENDQLQSLLKHGDYCFRLLDRQGPFSVLRGDADESILEIAAGIIAQHTKYRHYNSVKIACWRIGFKFHNNYNVKASSLDEVKRVRI